MKKETRFSQSQFHSIFIYTAHISSHTHFASEADVPFVTIKMTDEENVIKCRLPRNLLRILALEI